MLTILASICLPFSARAAEFNPNFIISDSELTDYTSMTLEGIQRFLENQPGTLKNFVHSGKTAAELIFSAAWAERINPKYILVTLQKEQSLITKRSPRQKDYDWATGYAICDSCSKSDPRLQKYKGFKNQVDYAAGSARFFLDNPHKLTVKPGPRTIDGQPLNIANRATAFLYTYTPHLHGNSNFHRFYDQWFGKVYPTGTLLHAPGSPDVWVIQHGIKRTFESAIALNSRYDTSRLIEVDQEVLDQYTTGTEIKFPNYALIRSPKGTICLIVDDKKRCITSEEVFREIGFHPEEVIDVGWGDFNDFIDGAPIVSADAHPTGALVQNNTTGAVYWVMSGVRHPIVDRAILQTRFKGFRISQVTPEILEENQPGDAVRFPDGTLVRSDVDPAVYVVAAGELRPIVTAEVFESYNYDWNKVVFTTGQALEIHPVGEPLNIGAG